MTLRTSLAAKIARQNSAIYQNRHAVRSRLQPPGRPTICLFKAPRLWLGLRQASTSVVATVTTRSVTAKSRLLLVGTTIGLLVSFGYLYATDTRAGMSLQDKWHLPHLGQANTVSGIHQWIVVPSLRWIYDDAEEAHEAGTKSLKVLYQFGLHPRERGKSDDAGDLEVEVSQSCHSNQQDAFF